MAAACLYPSRGSVMPLPCRSFEMAIAACATPLVGAIAEKFGFEGAATRSVPQHGYLHKGVASTACDVFADLLQCCAHHKADGAQQPGKLV